MAIGAASKGLEYRGQISLFVYSYFDESSATGNLRQFGRLNARTQVIFP